MKQIYVFLLALLFAGNSFSQQTLTDSIFVGGVYRSYILYVPAVYNASTAVPLILNLHGYTSSNAAQMIYGDFRPIADTANFILVHPNGTYDQYNKRYWNCWTTPGSGVDDVGFLSALIDSISAAYSIDADRVYSTGLSNGGFMSNDLACFLSSRITAIASVAAGMSSVHKSYCNPLHPTPVMEIHGTADATVPYNGATGMLHVDSVIKYWSQYNSCTQAPLITPVPNTSSTDGCTADNYLYANGTNGSTVELYKVTNGGHSWPGAMYVAGLGNVNQDFKASAEIWRFFRKYKLSALTGVNENNITGNSIQIFPVPFSDELNFSFPGETEIKTIRLLDLSGRILFRTDLNKTSKDFSIRVAVLNEGIYIAEVETSSGTARKIITN
jgi:polyhydroxybutyrate depolymerase